MITYLNTDLDLAAPCDLRPLAEAFNAAGLIALHVTQTGEEAWHACFERYDVHDGPDATIAAMLGVVEGPRRPARSLWSRCTLREFNIGYDCGDEPWAYNDGLAHATLARIARAGAALRITLYPPTPPDQRANRPASRGRGKKAKADGAAEHLTPSKGKRPRKPSK